MSRKHLDMIIKGIPFPFYMIMVLSSVIGYYVPDYLSAFYLVNELFNCSVLSGILLLAISYRHKLCLYHKISSWAIFSSGILNVLAILFLDGNNYQLYINIYVHFLLIPTTAIVSYYLIKSYDRK